MAEQSGGGAVAHRGGRGSRRNEGRIKDDSTLIKGLSKFPTAKWYQFGLELNVPSGILKGIERGYIQRGGVKKCLNETLIWWYNNTRGCATWGDICTALHAVEEGALAAKVAKEHGCSPFIVHHPESKNVDLGEKTVTFTCVADGTPPLQYSWKFNGEEMKEETNNTLTISSVSRKVAGKYECCVNNKFDNVTSSPAELIIGKMVTEDSMYGVLIKSGVQAADWLVIAKQLKLTTQMLAGVFLKAWKESDYTRPSWEKLAKALRAIGGGWYENASQQAEKNAGDDFTVEQMCEMFKEAKVEEPNWLEVSSKLRLILYDRVSSSELYQVWSKHGPSWNKLIQALEKLDGYQQVVQQAKKKAVLEISEDSMVATFMEACVEVPENWREIGVKLGLNLRGKLSAAEFFKGWKESSFVNKPSWANLAGALQKMEGYQDTALLAMNKEPAEMSESNMCSVFRDIDEVDWALLGQKLCPTQMLINDNCLKHALKRWHKNMKGDPWTTWRKLSVVVGSVYGFKAWQELKQLAGVALKLNADNMSMVLNKAGIYEAADVASALGLSQSLGQWYKRLFGVQRWAAVLAVWKEQGSYVSWNKLAEAVQRKHGVDSSQIILEISGEGGCPTIATHPANKHIAVGRPVVFECQATGAPPLMYTWMHDGIDMPAKNQRRLEFVVHQRSRGEYSCRVENKFGSSKSDPAMLHVGDFPNITSITGEKHIKTGGTIYIHCTATGEQPLKYSWWFSSVTPSTSSSAVLPNEDGPTLVIPDAKEKDHQGFYQCRVTNSFGQVISDFLNIKVGPFPYIDVHPEIQATVEPGDFLRLKCKATGKGTLHYVWQHDNQTLVKETRPELIIKHVKESDQGAYKCCVTNAFGYVLSNPAVLKLSTTQAELMKELAPHVAPKWYMFAVLLNISKPIVDRISRSFTVHGNFDCCLSEVVEAWLEEMNAASHKMTSHVLTNVEYHRQRQHWIQIYYVIKRMGYMTLAQDLYAKHKLLAKAAGINEEKSEAEVTVDASKMQQRFTVLINKVQPILATSDANPTATISTSHSDIDTSIGDCIACLHLIDFSQEETNNISDVQSLLDFVVPYLDFQRFHILEMIVGQFKSEKARESTQKYRDLLNNYQSQVNLGKFVLAIVMRTPPANPPFMRPFSLQLESKWATCTIQDLENLLTQILPKSVGHIFVWFYKAHQVAHDNSICLDYIISPSIVEILKNEAERKQDILRSAGVLSISIDGTNFRPKDGAGVCDGDHGGGGDDLRSNEAGMDKMEVKNQQIQTEIVKTVEQHVQTGSTAKQQGYLRGVEVIEHITFTYTGKAQSFEWLNHGFKMHFPDNALPPNVNECQVHVRVSLCGQFQFPENMEQISGIYWILSPHTFTKPATIEIQHCAAKPDHLKHPSNLKFVVAKCTQDLPYQFKILDGGVFSPSSQYGSIELTQFSGVGVVFQSVIQWLGLRSSQPEPNPRCYCARLYYSSIGVNSWEVYFTVTWDMELHISAADTKYGESGTKVGPDQEVAFEEEQITLDIKADGIVLESGWTIFPDTYPRITKSQVDRFVPGGRVPSCQLYVEWTGQQDQPVQLVHRVKLLGAKEPNNFFLMRPPALQRSQALTGVAQQMSKSTESGPVQESLGSKYLGLTSEPELSDLMNEVASKVYAKWKEISIQLGLTLNDQKYFMELTLGDPKQCFTFVFTVWKSRATKPYTWSTVIQTLESPAVDEMRLAQELRTKLQS